MTTATAARHWPSDDERYSILSDQRDELVAALEKLIDRCAGTNVRVTAAYQEAREVLAKARA